jgi:hypothetical protein
MAANEIFVPIEQIEPKILLIRGRKVLLDADLAELYGTNTKTLNQAVKRNASRFPPDFMFRLSAEEKKGVFESCTHLRRLRFSPALPYAFTEHGAIMAASVLNTARAVEISTFIVRAFVKLRETLSAHKELAAKLAELERRVGEHDESIQALVATIRQLMAPQPQDDGRRIGFHVDGQAKIDKQAQDTDTD